MLKPRCTPRRRPPSGLTIVEGLIALTVVEVAVFAVSLALNSGRVHVEEADGTMQAVTLAETLVEEILVLPYTDPDGPSDPGPEADERNRADFDNVDDFEGYADTAGPSVGAPPGAFARSVAVSYINEHVDDLDRSIPGLTVAVTVMADGRARTVTRFIAEPAS